MMSSKRFGLGGLSLVLLLSACATQAEDEVADTEGAASSNNVGWALSRAKTIATLDDAPLSEATPDGSACWYEAKLPTPGEADIDIGGFHRYRLPKLRGVDGISIHTISGFPAVLCMNGGAYSKCDIRSDREVWAGLSEHAEDGKPGSDAFRSATDILVMTRNSYDAKKFVRQWNAPGAYGPEAKYLLVVKFRVDHSPGDPPCPAKLPTGA